MHDNDLDADQIEQYEIVDDRVLQLVIDHCVAAVLDDNGLTVIFLDIRKSLDQNVGAQLRIHMLFRSDGSIHANSFLFKGISYHFHNLPKQEKSCQPRKPRTAAYIGTQGYG